MTGYVRKDTTNNIADGNVINAADLDSEFDGVQAAFNASTGHKHDGTASEGATINSLGPTQDVTISASLVAPKTTNFVDIGSSGLKFKDMFLAGNGSIGGTLAVTGVATFTAQPILSSLTASRAVFSDGSKGLVSNAITGTGNVVMSASPTLTGTVGGASLTLSSLTSGRVTYAGASGLLQDSANLLFNGTTLTANTLNLTNALGTTYGGTGLTSFTSGGVVYASNASTLATGSALTFDGTNLGVGIASPANTYSRNVQIDGSASAGIRFTSTSYTAGFDVVLSAGDAYLLNRNNTAMIFATGGGVEHMRLTSTGLGIGTSSPSKKLEVANSDALIYGITVGRGAGAQANNTAVGASALAANTTGNYGIAIGNQALQANTTGQQNSAAGGYTLVANTTGNYNAGFGTNALLANTTGSNNTAIGTDTLYSNTTASNNTAVGYQAGYTNVTGTNITAVGYQAGFYSTSGQITAFGNRALLNNTTGQANTAVGGPELSGGLSALQANTTGSYNVGIGQGSLAANTTASNNTAVGYQAGYSNTTGVNSAFGSSALYANTTGSSNNAFGYLALTANTTGATNSAFGQQALSGNTTGSNNIAIGQETLRSNTTASNNTAVGYQAAYTNATGAGLTAIGYQAAFTANTVNGVAVGYRSLYENTTGATNTAVGYASFRFNTTGTSGTAIGDSALFANTTGSYNTALGKDALQANTTASNNTAVGYQAGYSNQTSGGGVFIGYQAGYSSVGVSTTINYNTAIGYQAGYALTSGYGNALIGNGAGSVITTGYKNSILGTYSGNQGGLDIRTASNYIVLSDGDGNPRQIIDASGNLGLGVTPSAWSGYRALQVGGATSIWSSTSGAGSSFYSNNVYFNGSNRIRLNAGYATEYIQDSSAGSHIWFNAASSTAGSTITLSKAMTLDASGNLLVGTTNADTAAAAAIIERSGTTVSTGAYFVIKNQNVAQATNGVLTPAGGILFSTYRDIRDPAYTAGITYEARGVSGTNTGAELIFRTSGGAGDNFANAGNSALPAERARIDTSGNLLVGTTSAGGGSNVKGTTINEAGQIAVERDGGIAGVFNRFSSDGQLIIFRRQGTTVGDISVTTLLTTYNTTSDYRLKTVIGAVADSGSRLDALQPVEYEWKADGSRTRGFLAHQFQEIYAGSVTGTKDAVDADGKPVYQAMQASTSEVIADLVAEIQSLRIRIAQLEAK